MIDPRLIIISDTDRAPGGLLEARVARCCDLARPGSVVVQLRDLSLPARERLRLGERLVKIARQTGQCFIVNDRLDFALLLGADGVHLGEEGIDSAAARSLLAQRSAEAWISRAWHDPSLAPEGGADAYLLSPVVAARKGRAAWGIESLSHAKATLSKLGSARLFALGGVDEATASACLEAGADGVAVIGAVLGVDDPQPLLAALGIAKA